MIDYKNLWFYQANLKMGKGSFWVIDGIKVKKKNPFVFENIPRQ